MGWTSYACLIAAPLGGLFGARLDTWGGFEQG